MSSWAHCLFGVLLVTSACGRIGFDERAVGAGDDAGSEPVGDADVREAQWWRPDCPERLPVLVENPSTQTLAAGFVVQLHLAVEAAVPSEELHLLHFDATNEQWSELARIVERPAADKADLWFGIPVDLGAGEASDGLYLYLGSCDTPPATPPSGLHLYSEFDGPIDTSQWEAQGPMTPMNGALHMETLGSLRSLQTYGPGTAIEFRARIDRTDTEFWGGFQRIDDHVDSGPWTLWISRYARPGQMFSASENAPINWEGASFTADTNWHRYRIERFLDHHLFYRDGVLVETFNHLDYDTELQIRLRVDDDPPDLREAWFDSVKVWSVVEPPPTTSVQASETL